MYALDGCYVAQLPTKGCNVIWCAVHTRGSLETSSLENNKKCMYYVFSWGCYGEQRRRRWQPLCEMPTRCGCFSRRQEANSGRFQRESKSGTLRMITWVKRNIAAGMELHVAAHSPLLRPWAHSCFRAAQTCCWQGVQWPRQLSPSSFPQCPWMELFQVSSTSWNSSWCSMLATTHVRFLSLNGCIDFDQTQVYIRIKIKL